MTCLCKLPNQNQEQFESFCENLIDVLLGIDNQQPTCSILVGDFNAKLSNQCPNDKGNKAEQDIDKFTTISGYTQMIGQPSHIINDKSSCIDFLPLIANFSVMLESSTLFIINAIIILYMDHLISTYLSLHHTIGTFGTIKTHIRYVYSVQFD